MRFHSRLGLGLWLLAIAGAPTLLGGQSPAPPSLGAADSFAILAGTSVTSTGSTVVTGNLGVSPGNTISGSITVKVGAAYRDDSVARQAQRDATSAYNNLANRACTATLTTDLGGLTLGPGVYCFSSTAQLTGTLILDAANDPNAFWIFKIGTTLTTAANSSVRVINNGYENNIFWQIGDSITLNAGTAFLGNVLAHKDIALGSAASISGRLLAQGSVSLNGNNVSLCCGHITLSPATLLNGVAGVAYSTATIIASGGIAPYTFIVSSGKLPDGLFLNLPTPGVISGTPTKTGIFAFTITATDSHGCTGTQAYVINVSCQTITVNNPAVNTGTVNVDFNQTFTASNTVGTKTFTLNSGTLPAGLTLSATGVLSGTPTQSGTFPITVKVVDGNGCSAVGGIYNLTIGCQVITVSNPPVNTGTVNLAFSQTFTASNSVGTKTFTLNSGTLPAGLTLSATGVLSGTPIQTGMFPITVKVVDGNGCSAIGGIYDLTVGCQVITVRNPSVNIGTVNVVFSQTFTAGNAIGTVTFALNSGTLPNGLTLSTTGVLSGTPMQSGIFPIVVKVTDANGCTGLGSTYTLTINPAGCPLVLSPPTLPGGTPGVLYNEVLTASGGVAPYTFTENGPLPAGLTFTPTSPTTATISGIPTSPGCSTFDVTAIDANGCTITITYTICIAAGGPALTGWGMVLLSILLAGTGFVMIRRGA